LRERHDPLQDAGEIELSADPLGVGEPRGRRVEFFFRSLATSVFACS
jgi:hypothetical protein